MSLSRQDRGLVLDGAGYRSPNGNVPQYQGTTSPAGQGRSVREFEEQMLSLRKENFNLKLRLYFLEENVPGYQHSKSASPDEPETLVKQLIDAKVEMEMLRKDIAEKQDILKEAAQAMNQMEKIQKDTEEKSGNIITELHQKISTLEAERIDKWNSVDFSNPECLSTLQKVRELEENANGFEERYLDLQAQVKSMSEGLAKRDETIKEYEDKVRELVIQNAELQEQLETRERQVKQAETQRLQEELQSTKADLADKICMLQETEEQLDKRVQIHEQACKTIQKLVLSIKTQEDEIQRLRLQSTSQKETTTGSSSQEHLRTYADSEVLCELTDVEKLKYEAIIGQNEATIEELRAEVKKKTASLQNLVNKELWEKNREIERLVQLVNKNSANSPSSPPVDSGNELQQSFTDADYAKALERNKLLQRKVDILIQRLSGDRDQDSLVAQLRSDLRESQEKATSAEKWRSECADVCAMLSTRLEELAGFLNSLLKHKDVLGVLAADRRRAIRKAVDTSLDLSKSLNVTLSMSAVSLGGNQSLCQLSNLSQMLCDVEGFENCTFNSHEDSAVPAEAIESLRAENQALKRELDKRRSAEFKKDRRSLPLAEQLSESEAWSEPDRKVSLARIGLEDHSAAKDITSQRGETDSDSAALNQSRNTKSRNQERILQLEKMIAQRDERILQIQCDLVEADNRLKMENLRVIELKHDGDELRQRNAELKQDLLAIGSVQDDSLLQRQVEEKTERLERLQEERDRIAVEARLAEMQITSLKTELDDVQVRHEVALALATERGREQLRAAKAELEKRLRDKEAQYQAMLERDYIARSLYEEQLGEMQNQNVEAQRTIDYLTESEQELKQTLVECEVSARALKKQLDESTLQASRAVLERTKALNDKLHLEREVETLQQQLNTQKTERSALQRRLTQLEGVQQALQEQLAVATAATQRSDGSNSGYTSEEVPQQSKDAQTVLTTSVVALATGQNVAVVVGAQRLNNPSPDLGIDSDAGRVSSAELMRKSDENDENRMDKNAAKKELQGEDVLREVMANNQSGMTGGSSVMHDCAKVETENAELRRKLIRTKRAFEDTYEKLRVANQKKAQIEKDIKSQILKTHNVLKNVRSNMENEL